MVLLPCELSTDSKTQMSKTHTEANLRQLIGGDQSIRAVRGSRGPNAYEVSTVG